MHDDQAIRAWLYRIATNRCLNILRARKPVSPLLEEVIPPANPAMSPEARAEAHERLVPCASRSTGSPPNSGPAGC